MSNTGRFYVHKDGRTFVVEPISKHANRNSGWKNGLKDSDMAKGGAVHPDDSIIKDDEFKNIVTLGPGVSPLSYIDKLLKEKDGIN